ncbi:hypothetical protein ACHAQJ_009148 [Trichoderma viride]
MKDQTLDRNDSKDAASSCPPNGDDLQNVHADTKGKQKIGLELAAAHLEASGKMVVNAIVTSRDMPNLASDVKTSSASGYPGSSSYLAGESSSYQVHQQTSFKPTRKTADECQNDLFDAFTEHSTEALAIAGHRLDISGPSCIDQETSDGSAVLEVLSQPENESYGAAFSPEYDSYASKEDKLWSAALDEKSSDQEEEERLDFTPDFITRPEIFQQAKPYLGTGDIRETSSTWFGYWNDVFTTYNARVWGNSQPMTTSKISEQRKVEQDHDSSEPVTVTRALSRLKLIFHHLRG